MNRLPQSKITRQESNPTLNATIITSSTMEALINLSPTELFICISVTASATTIVSVRNTQVIQMALMALTEPHTFWGRIPYFLLHIYLHYFAPGLWWRIHTIRTTCVLHSSQGLLLCCSHLYNVWWCLCLFSADSHIVPHLFCFTSDAALAPNMFRFEILSHIAMQSSLRIHRLLLHLLCHYRILQVWNMQSNLHTL